MGTLWDCWERQNLLPDAARKRTLFNMEQLTATLPSRGGDLGKGTHPEERDRERVMLSPDAII